MLLNLAHDLAYELKQMVDIFIYQDCRNGN